MSAGDDGGDLPDGSCFRRSIPRLGLATLALPPRHPRPPAPTPATPPAPAAASWGDEAVFISDSGGGGSSSGSSACSDQHSVPSTRRQAQVGRPQRYRPHPRPTPRRVHSLAVDHSSDPCQRHGGANNGHLNGAAKPRTTARALTYRAVIHGGDLSRQLIKAFVSTLKVIYRISATASMNTMTLGRAPVGGSMLHCALGNGLFGWMRKQEFLVRPRKVLKSS